MTRPKRNGNVCVDCGVALVTGVRCREHNGVYIKMQTAKRMESEDRALLAMISEEKLSPTDLAARMGISRQAAEKHIHGARRRLALLQPVA